MNTVVIKQHDTRLTFVYTPTINDEPVPPGDLVGATVAFLLNDGNGTAIKQAANISAGKFIYDPADSDVAKDGEFRQEWEVLYPTGKILTFPNGGYNTVKIVPDLG